MAKNNKRLAEDTNPQGLQRLEPLAGTRQKGETAAAVKACNMYLRMRNRSLRKVMRRLERAQNGSVTHRSQSTLHQQVAKWSKDYMWVARAEAYDRMVERYHAARAKQIMESGIAQTHERVLQLQQINELLVKQLENGALYLSRKKNLKDTQGNNVIVEELKYNQALIKDVLQTLDDAARETGGRRQSVDVAVSGLAEMLGDLSGLAEDNAGEYVEVEIIEPEDIDPEDTA